jgi:hypothetical protein
MASASIAEKWHGQRSINIERNNGISVSVKMA